MMLEELHVSPAIIQLLANVREGQSTGYEDMNWNARVSEYADSCVTPNGIEGFEIRLQDLQKRYSYLETKVWESLHENAKRVEANTTVPLQDMRNIDFSQLMRALSAYDIQIEENNSTL